MSQRALTTDSSSSRVLVLDVLRGLAAMYVVFEHYLWSYPQDHAYEGVVRAPLIISAQFAVHLFFLISGYVIFFTISKSATLRQFAIARFCRLFPAYWAALTFTLIVVLLFTGQLVKSMHWSEVLVNYTMLQVYLGFKNVDGVYWTLAVELAFYCWIALFAAMKLMPHILTIGWIWLGVCLVGLCFQDYGPGDAPLAAGTSFPMWLDFGLLLRYAPLFFAGIAFRKLHQGERRRGLHAFIVACFFVYLAVCVWPGMGLGLRTVFAAGCIFAVFYAMVYHKVNWIAFGPLVFLGTISYSLYITHCVAGGVTRYWLVHTAGMADTLALLIVIIGAIAVATALTFGVERPANRALRKALHRWTQRPVPQPATPG